jgi:hypothetical protein
MEIVLDTNWSKEEHNSYYYPPVQNYSAEYVYEIQKS